MRHSASMSQNSLWPGNIIWRHRPGSTLVQVMDWCLTAPSHYMNQCWIPMSEVLWHSHESNFIASVQATILLLSLKILLWKLLPHLTRAKELTCYLKHSSTGIRGIQNDQNCSHQHGHCWLWVMSSSMFLRLRWLCIFINDRMTSFKMADEILRDLATLQRLMAKSLQLRTRSVPVPEVYWPPMIKQAEFRMDPDNLILGWC